jgi:hypothetical protein
MALASSVQLGAVLFFERPVAWSSGRDTSRARSNNPPVTPARCPPACLPPGPGILLLFVVVCCCRTLGGNALTGTFPAVEFNALTNLTYL